MSVITETSKRLLEAYETGKPIAPIRDRISGVSEAYAVQQATVEVWLKRGRRLAGQKIGLTSKAVQAQLGFDEPDFGVLFADMILEDGAEIPRGKVLQPRVEGELAFVLNSDLRGERLSVEDVINATDFISPAIEICGSRIAGWDIRIADTISDNASSGLVVLGKARMKPLVDELPRIPLAIRRGADAVADGRGEACLGNPAIAVAWLGEMLTRFSGGLRAGDVIMSGALCRMIPAEPGNAFVANFGDLGSVRVQFAS